MRIEFTGRQIEVPAAVRRLGERRLAKLARVLPGVTHAHVILSTDRHRQVAEVAVRSPRLDLLAQEGGADLGASLAAAFDKLERQARDRVGKRLDRKRRGGSRRAERSRARAAAPPAPRDTEAGIPRRRVAGAVSGRTPSPRPAEASRRVIRSERVTLRPLSLEQAALELEGRAEGFLLFRDARSARMGLLYRRRDGQLGLLEPEA